MKTIEGAYSTIKIFTDNVEDTAMEQIHNMANHEITKQTKVRIMPDCHAGYGSTIGTTIALPEKFKDWRVSPSIVGVDINCGVLMYKLANKDVDLSKLDTVINKSIPSGFNTHNKPKNVEFTQDILDNLTFDIEGKIAERIHKSLGTLGGGNHFIELGKDEEDNYWLAVHSGSRNLGVQVANYHQNIAIESLAKQTKVDIKPIIEKLKNEGRHSEIENTIKELNKDNKKLTKDEERLSYLTEDLLMQYLIDMDLAQEYAKVNRATMLDIIIEQMDLTVVDKFDSAHNFIEHDNFTNGIIRKGATSAKVGERLVIPLNMRDGSLICEGKGNVDWNSSAPHGAGRLMSRTKAMKQLNMSDFKEQMNGIYSSSIVESVLDEAPDAYKPAEEIMAYIKPTVEVIHLVKPVYNYKAH
ncbi:MAG TPA: RtcB family protein [Clostridiales bacterium]|nr:RtcB family protein [Clostridiales bacterium]